MREAASFLNSQYGLQPQSFRRKERGRGGGGPIPMLCVSRVSLLVPRVCIQTVSSSFLILLKALCFCEQGEKANFAARPRARAQTNKELLDGCARGSAHRHNKSRRKKRSNYCGKRLLRSMIRKLSHIHRLPPPSRFQPSSPPPPGRAMPS